MLSGISAEVAVLNLGPLQGLWARSSPLCQLIDEHIGATLQFKGPRQVVHGLGLLCMAVGAAAAVAGQRLAGMSGEQGRPVVCLHGQPEPLFSCS